jgi:hypothetical protein
MPYDETAFDVHVAMIVSSLGAGHSIFFCFFLVFLPFLLSPFGTEKFSTLLCWSQYYLSRKR